MSSKNQKLFRRAAVLAVILLVVTVAACNPQKGGYGNSNGQPPATMTTVGGYSGQAGAG